MSEAIRVLHFADVHVGMENYGRTDPQTGLSSRVLDFVHRMDEMCDYAALNDVDLIIFAGDAFKNANPNATFQREFAHRIQDLAQLAPVHLLVGNHDIPQNRIKASSVEIYQALNVPNVSVEDDYTVRQVETKRGPVILGFAPYPTRQHLLSFNDSKVIHRDLDQYLRSSFDKLIISLAEEAEALDPENKIPRLLSGHFSISGAKLGSEREFMLGRDIAIGLSTIADPVWDYVAMGHIHKHQNLTAGREDRPPVVYSGSLERIDFGEANDPKGFCWVDLQRNQTAWQFVEVDARPFVDIHLDCILDTDPTQRVLTQINKLNMKNAVVKVTVELAPETQNLLNETQIREAIKFNQAFSIASINKRIQNRHRARLGANPEGLSQEELLERFFAAKEIPEAHIKSLMEIAREMMQSEE